MTNEKALPLVPDADAVLDANRQQAEQWNGESGQRWRLNQERMDVLLQPFLDAGLAAAALRKGEQVLDVGVGCGATTLALAEAVGLTGRAVGIDVSHPLLERARSRAEAEGSAARFILADAASFDFPPACFDLLFSRFGVMFFGDPAAAFANLRRAMKKGGRAVFICWRPPAENEWLRVPRDVAERHCPPLPPEAPGAPGPFAFADPAHVGAILLDAGWSDPRFARFDHHIRLGEGAHGDPAEDAIADVMRVSPLARRLEGQDPALRARALGDLRSELRRRVDAGAVTLSTAVWIVGATA